MSWLSKLSNVDVKVETYKGVTDIGIANSTELITNAEITITELDLANILAEQTITNLDLRVLELEAI